MKAAHITISIPFPDEADIGDAQAAADAIANLALSSVPGMPSPAGITPAFYGRVAKVELKPV